ncbi:sensor histidine kinase [Actinospica sp.]|uniref:sensor histidine kinase n=1 Tax=Actinospica sp. TaxID=1872142 RepID=UPI002CD390D3|nr:histidine kinase [Actinospica sp.]HWG26662.1 histidine kinase [Actinospica sp.]
MTSAPGQAPAAVSPRLALAMAGARDRKDLWSARLRPVLWAVVLCVLIATLRGTPAAGWSGTGLGVSIALVGCLLPMAAAAAHRWPLETPAECAALPLIIGVSGIALAAQQSNGISALPASVAVMCAFLFLQPATALVLGSGITAGLFVADLVGAGRSGTDAFTQVLFCAVLAAMAWCMRQAGLATDRAELLLAQLEDAKEAEAAAAAMAERTRIAQDLHDVLAQSLSGLAIQLEAARRMARRPDTDEALREVIERSGRLVKDGMSEARRAVGALRGEGVPTVDRLTELIERYRDDLGLDVTLTSKGTARDLPTDAGMALYRGVQEALTNVVRYAQGATACVVLHYEDDATVLTVEDRRPESAPVPAPLVNGSGLGLVGLRERLAEVGGSVAAGPTKDGWIVRMEVRA